MIKTGSRPKILVLVPDLRNMGGVSTLFRGLEEKFTNYDIIYFSRGYKVNTKEFLQMATRITDYFKFFFKLLTQSYQHIHINTSLTVKNLYRDVIFVLIAKLLGYKVLLFFHGWNPDTVRGINNFFFKFYFKADSIIVLAEEFKNDLESWGYNKPIFVEKTAVSKELEQLLGPVLIKRSEVKNILFLSRVEKQKGIYETLMAFDLVRRNYQNLKLLIAGDGSELHKIREYIKVHQIKNVQLCGYVSGKSKAKLLEKSDIYIFPSYYAEGMPISVLEAMMAGLPVITSKTGGLRDFFEDGKMGLITDSKDPKVIAKMLNALISDQCNLSKISEYNYKYARDNFTVDKLVERLEYIYSVI